jgi:hypothetical protein
MLKKGGSSRTFKQVVGQLKNDQSESWIGKKVENIGEV